MASAISRAPLTTEVTAHAAAPNEFEDEVWSLRQRVKFPNWYAAVTKLFHSRLPRSRSRGSLLSEAVAARSARGL